MYSFPIAKEMAPSYDMGGSTEKPYKLWLLNYFFIYTSALGLNFKFVPHLICTFVQCPPGYDGIAP